MSSPIISPARVISRTGAPIQFGASGGSGSGYVFSFANPGDNASGASLNGAAGAYIAGPKTIVTDRITVTDGASNTAVATVDLCGNLYRVYQSTKIRTGDWQGQNIKLLESDLGSEKDIQFERARQAVLSNNPAVCPDDALAYIGQERQLPQGVAESNDDYRARLQGCWERDDGWSFAGSHGGLLFALARAGFPTGDPNGAHIMQRINLYSWLSGSPLTVHFGTHPIWTFDGSPPNAWNQFGIVFGADVAGLSSGTQLAATLNQLVALWKPAKARFMGTWIIVSGPTWGWPVGTLWGGAGLTWGGGVTRFVPPT